MPKRPCPRPPRAGGRCKRGRAAHGPWYTRRAVSPPPDAVPSHAHGGCFAPSFTRDEERIRGLRGDAAIIEYRKLAKRIAEYNKGCVEGEPKASTHYREITRCYPVDLSVVCDKATLHSIENRVLWLSRHKTYCADLLRTMLLTLYEQDAPVDHFSAILSDTSKVVSRHLFWPGGNRLPNTPEVTGVSDTVRRVRQDFLDARRQYPVDFPWGEGARNEFRETLHCITTDLLGSLKAMLQQGYWLRCFDKLLCEIRSIGYKTIKVKKDKSSLRNMLLVDPTGSKVCDMIQLRDAFKTGKATGEFAIDVLVRESRAASNVTSSMRWSGKIARLTGAHLKQHLALNRYFKSEEEEYMTGTLVASSERPLEEEGNCVGTFNCLKSRRAFKDTPEVDYTRKFVNLPIKHVNNACGLDPSLFDFDVIVRYSTAVSVRGRARRRPVRAISRCSRERGSLFSLKTDGVGAYATFHKIVYSNEDRRKPAPVSGERDDLGQYLFAANDKGRVQLDQFEFWCGSTTPDQASAEEKAYSKSLSRKLTRDRFNRQSWLDTLNKRVERYKRETVVATGGLLETATLETHYAERRGIFGDDDYSLDRWRDRMEIRYLLSAYTEGSDLGRGLPTLRWRRKRELVAFYAREYGELARMALRLGRKLVIFDGAVGFAATGHGETPVPTTARAKALMTVLESYPELEWSILPTPETNTTKLHHACLNATRPWKVHGKNTHDHRWCKHCKQRFSRDRNAARNILCVGLSLWLGFLPPDEFKLSADEVAWVEMTRSY